MGKYIRGALSGAVVGEVVLLVGLTVAGFAWSQSMVGVGWFLVWLPALTPVAVVLGVVGGIGRAAWRTERTR